jgi:hypothetical protein
MHAAQTARDSRQEDHLPFTERQPRLALELQRRLIDLAEERRSYRHFDEAILRTRGALHDADDHHIALLYDVDDAADDRLDMGSRAAGKGEQNGSCNGGAESS